MRSLVLLALLWSVGAWSDAEVSAAQRELELATIAREAAQQLEEHASYVTLLQPMPDRMLMASEMKPYVLLGNGWSGITEAGGVWSLDKRSSLYIRIDEGKPPRRLLIQGRYFNGKEATRLMVNGQLLGETSLENYSVDLPPGLISSSSMHIELHHVNPEAPRDIRPNSTDSRKIKFNLEQIRVW